MTHIHQLYNEWLSLQPLKPEDKNRLDRKFMLEFNYNSNHIWGIERSGFFNGREKWAKGFENQRV